MNAKTIQVIYYTVRRVASVAQFLRETTIMAQRLAWGKVELSGESETESSRRLGVRDARLLDLNYGVSFIDPKGAFGPCAALILRLSLRKFATLCRFITYLALFRVAICMMGLQ